MAKTPARRSSPGSTFASAPSHDNFSATPEEDALLSGAIPSGGPPASSAAIPMARAQQPLPRVIEELDSERGGVERALPRAPNLDLPQVRSRRGSALGR